MPDKIMTRQSLNKWTKNLKIPAEDHIIELDKDKRLIHCKIDWHKIGEMEVRFRSLRNYWWKDKQENWVKKYHRNKRRKISLS